MPWKDCDHMGRFIISSGGEWHTTQLQAKCCNRRPYPLERVIPGRRDGAVPVGTGLLSQSAPVSGFVGETL
jgi:hypothetical protein